MFAHFDKTVHSHKIFASYTQNQHEKMVHTKRCNLKPPYSKNKNELKCFFSSIRIHADNQSSRIRLEQEDANV